MRRERAGKMLEKVARQLNLRIVQDDQLDALDAAREGMEGYMRRR